MIKHCAMYEDEFYLGFEHGEFEKMKEQQKELEDNSFWEDTCTKLEIHPMAEPMDAEIMLNTPGNLFTREILVDTTANAKIMVGYNGKLECLRDCALPSLLSTIGLNGPAIKRATKYNLAKGLTAFLDDSRAHSKILVRSGKVAAILSTEYEYMKISKLLEICEDLSDSFGQEEFIGGFIEHKMSVAEFAYPESAPQITNAYNAVLTNLGRNPSTSRITPVVQFKSSDTSNDSATLTTYLRTCGRMIPVSIEKVPHKLSATSREKGETGLDIFRQKSEGLFAKMTYDIDKLFTDMANTPIQHPGNCFIGLCKYAEIPQKWGGAIEESLRMDWPDFSGCTFLDIYDELTKTTVKAIEDNKQCSERVLKLEEGICKIAQNKSCWTLYDLPGTVAWTQKVPAAAH